MLDGGAACVERVDELVAAEAGEAFSFAAYLPYLLYLLAVLVSGEQAGCPRFSGSRAPRRCLRQDRRRNPPPARCEVPRGWRVRRQR